MAYCQGWLSARVSGMAEPKMVPMAAGRGAAKECAGAVVGADLVEQAAKAERDAGRPVGSGAYRPGLRR